jgi:putative glycosyltransferase (TIGR04372 family)
MPIHFRVLSYIGKVTGTVILVPHPIAIGNYAEEIYFGLLKARRESKKLLILQPYQLFGYLRLGLHNNRVLLSLRSKYRSPFQNSFFFPAACWFITIYFGIFRAISIVLQRFFGKRISDRYIIPMMGQETLWQPDGEGVKFSWDVVNKYKWAEQINTPLHLELSEDQLKESNLLRSKMGLPKDAWFVCLHVRDGGYYSDHRQAENRNADITNYIPAIREVTDRGGWVVRMGDPKMTPLPSMYRVIDYPFTVSKCPLMDMYLIKECTLYIGMLSGILDAAILFERPIVLTNMCSCMFAYPLRASDIGIFKNVYSKSKNRFISPYEWPSMTWGGHSNFLPEEDFVYEENSAEELKDVVREYFNRDSNWRPSANQIRMNNARIEGGYKLFGEEMISNDPWADVMNRYRLASRLEAASGVISDRFLFQKSNANEGDNAKISLLTQS